MNISVLTPDREIFAGPITSVKVPGVLGRFQILKNHAPIVSALEEGEVVIRVAAGERANFNEETGQVGRSAVAGGEIRFNISKGFVEVLNNEVALLVQGVGEVTGLG